MTRQTQQALVFLVSSVLALGVIGWLIWKVGVLDVVMFFVISIALLFPMVAVYMLILNPDTFNLMMDTLWATQDSINRKVSKVSPFNMSNVDLKSAIPAP
jgi:hypothetical protein